MRKLVTLSILAGIISVFLAVVCTLIAQVVDNRLASFVFGVTLLLCMHTFDIPKTVVGFKTFSTLWFYSFFIMLFSLLIPARFVLRWLPQLDKDISTYTSLGFILLGGLFGGAMSDLALRLYKGRVARRPKEL